MKVVSNRELPVSNQEFLEVLFGDEWGKAHVTAFRDDPSDIAQDRRALCWGGGAASDRLARFHRSENQYFAISLFQPLDSGRSVRRKAQFDACFVIVADDVAEKVPVERAEKLPPPTYKLHTSAGSEQWGWVLSEPCEDADRVNNLLDGLVAQGLAPDGTDPGMKGVTRYVRLPGGSNTKAKRLVDGEGFRCYLSEWHPERDVTLEALAKVFTIDLDAPRRDSQSLIADVSSDVVRDHPIWRHVRVEGEGNDGWVRVDCPNADKHSDNDPSGAAIRITQDGRVTFQCHHGHCNGEGSGAKLTGPRVVRLIDQQRFGGSGVFLDEVSDYQKKIYMRGVAEMVKSGQAFPGPRETGLREVSGEGDGEPAGRDYSFDPLRYVFLPHENRFYDVETGNTLAPTGLDNLYRKEMPPGKGRVMAAEYILSTMAPDLSVADGLGWKPEGLCAPPREQMIFEDEGKRLVNQWRGFALTPQPGDVSKWLEHAEYLIPDESQREVVLDYMAAIVQRVESKPGYFLGHRGSHRVGKDLLYRPLMAAMGPSIAREVQIDNLIGGWGDYIRGLKLCIVTEVDKAQDRRISNAMKTIVAPTAGGRRVLNLKGGAVSVELDCMGGVMMSNKRLFMAIEKGDMRYFIVDSWVDKRSPEYYGELTDWYDKDGTYAAILHYLLSRDISGFDHKVLPYVTEGALEMMESYRFDYEIELETMIEDCQPPFHQPVASAKEVRRLVKAEGLKCGLNGLDVALENLGWHKFRGAKKVDGRTKTTPTFYSEKLSAGASPVAVFEFYEQYQSGG